ncbi:MAG TPA: hypothetical protein VK892_00235, partial [Pyrinomonadaceae bacterium]|nr:hypothetical protein [Pyrinomonadaceae bacterium]
MNRLKSNSKKAFSFVVLIALALVVSAISTQILAQGGFHGAIFTSNSDGSATNQNGYDSKDDVYLNGGPQNMNANGLPNGTYYFQVTNPSGSVLLSTDPARCRQLTVAGGRVSNSAGPCPHPIGTPNSANGSTPVKLAPFNDSPNGGGVYKVWLIRQNSNTNIVGDPMTSPVLSFRSNDAKTDNFKIKSNTPPPPEDVTYTLSGCKFYDANANGIWNNQEVTVAGVRIRVTYGEVEVNTTTGEDGCWEVEGVPANAEYTVEEEVPFTGMEPSYYWVQTAPGAPSDEFRGYSGTANGPFTCDSENPEVCVGLIEDLDFGNVCFGPNLTGRTKGYWTNKNGENEMKTGAVDTTVFPAGHPQGMNGDLAFLSALNLYGES